MGKSLNTSPNRIKIINIIASALVIVFFSSIIVVYYKMVYNEKRENIIKSDEMIAKESADQIDRYLSTNIDSIKLASYTLNEMIVNGTSDEDIQQYLVAQSTAIRTAVIENSTGLYGYINGRFFSGTNWVPPEGYDATVRPWYTRPMKNPGDITILDPYVDVQSGNVMLAIGKTLCDNVSVISVDVSLDRIQDLTEEAVGHGNTDMEMVLNDECMVVAHSDRSEIGRFYSEEADSLGSEIAKRLNAAKNTYEFVYNGSNYVVYVEYMQNGWYCISVKDVTEVFGSLSSILFATIFVVIAIVLTMTIIMTRSAIYMHMTEEAISANEAKSVFLSNMSHEIRTPINVMLGMNEMILRETDDPSIRRYSENAKIAGKNLLGLVNDILDFSKIEAGKLEIIPVDYHIAVVINDMVNLIHSRTEKKGLTFKAEIDSSIPRVLNGDEIRIRQVISNLLTNAVKYTEKGSITLSISAEKLLTDSECIRLKVSVRDTGIGIKEEDMKKLFAVFERIEESRNRHIEGTGLGLSITENLLDMMGSKLSVESVYGEGSCFSFSLEQKVVSWEELGDYQAAYNEHLETKKRYREKFTAPGACILAVDDNQLNLMVFKSLVKKTGIKVDTANNGAEALRLSGIIRYDMIFLDHMMPDKDGIDTLHDIKTAADNPNRTTPTVCLTANAISGAREKYLEAGFDDYITKPVDSDKLEEILLAYLPAEKVVITEEEDDADETVNVNIFAALADTPIDTAAGLKNSGSLDAYISLLRIFYETVDQNTRDISDYLEAGELKNFTIRIHALKSSAKIIGASELGEMAQKLEDAGKTGDVTYLSGHTGLFMEEYAKFKKPLSKVVLDYESDADRPEAGEELIENAFEGIRTAALDMDCDELDRIFDELKNYSIPDDRKELYDKLRDALERYDYKTIVSLLS